MITLIAAVAENGVIGNKGTLPWRLPEDMKRFKALTMGKVALMGRKTWESIPEKFRPLPGRRNIVITRQSDYAAPEDVESYATIDDALVAHKDEDIMVIGGAEIYRQTIDRADILYITEIHREVDGDALFPEIKKDIWTETAREDHGEISFITYTRRS